MFVMILDAGIRGKGVDMSHAVATQLAIEGKKVAILDFSRCYKVSMEVLGYTSNHDKSGVTEKWFDGQITDEDIACPYAKLNGYDVPLYGISHLICLQNFQDIGGDISHDPRVQHFVRNIQMIKEKFEFILCIGEYVFSDAIAIMMLLAQRIYLIADSNNEADLGVKNIPLFGSKIWMCLGTSVSSGYQPPVPVAKVFEDVQIEHIVRSLCDS